MKTNGANDPFEDTGLRFGDAGFELCCNGRQISLGGQTVMPRFTQGFRKSFCLPGREMAFFPEGAGQAKSIKEKSAHQETMTAGMRNVHKHGCRPRTGQSFWAILRDQGQDCV